MPAHREDATPRLVPAVLLGIALGGFFDGILLHQILQWHHLLSLVPGPISLRTQILWDGIFHAVMYLIAAAALWLMWRDIRRGRPLPGRQLGAALLIGFGLWHILDGILSHWLLGIHRIRVDAQRPLLWDLAFFAGLGLVPVALGLMHLRGPGNPPGRPRASFAALVLLSASAGTWALQPPPDQPFTTAVFRPGLPAAEIESRLAALGARVVWAEPDLAVAILDLPPDRRFALYRQGALMVSGAASPAGCFSWSSSV